MRFEPAIKKEEAEEGFWGWELGGALIEELAEVAGAVEGLVAGALVELAFVLLQLDVGRVADEDVRTMLDAEHVFRVEPISDLLAGAAAKPAFYALRTGTGGVLCFVGGAGVWRGGDWHGSVVRGWWPVGVVGRQGLGRF